MPLIELLRPQQRDWLRKLRNRLANRELMRRGRADLCPGGDLPIEADTAASRRAGADGTLSPVSSPERVPVHEITFTVISASRRLRGRSHAPRA